QAGGVDEGVERPGAPAQAERRREVDGAEEVEVIGVPEVAGEEDPPGVEPVEDGEEQPLARREDGAERAVEEEEGRRMTEEEDGRGMTEEDDDRGRPVVAPYHERQADEEARQAPRRRAAGRHRVAVGDPASLDRQEPAARQEVQLVAADRLTRPEEDGEGEP